MEYEISKERSALFYQYPSPSSTYYRVNWKSLEIGYNRVKKRKNNADIYSCSGKAVNTIKNLLFYMTVINILGNSLLNPNVNPK